MNDNVDFRTLLVSIEQTFFECAHQLAPEQFIKTTKEKNKFQYEQEILYTQLEKESNNNKKKNRQNIFELQWFKKV